MIKCEFNLPDSSQVTIKIKVKLDETSMAKFGPHGIVKCEFHLPDGSQV